MAVAGISSLGVTFGYALETTSGTQPTAFTQLTRINSIGELTISPEVIDASALEDTLTKNIAGRDTVSDTIDVVVNVTDDTVSEWETVISTYSGRSNTNLRMWWEVIIPDISKAYFIVASPPSAFPMSSQEQNSLETVTMTLVVNEYVGLDTKIAFTTTTTTA